MACILAMGSAHPLWAQSGSDQYIVGVAAPATGPYAMIGELTRRGAQAAVDEINAAGGVNGKRLSLFTVTDNCSEEAGIASANQLVGRGVQLAIGHLCYAATRAAAQIYADADIIHVATTTQTPALTSDQRPNSLFRLAPREDRAHRIAAEALVTGAAGGNIALLHDGTAFGKGQIDGIKSVLNQDGIIESLNTSYEAGATEFDRLIRDLRDEAVSAVYIGGYHEDIGAIARAMTAARLRPAIVVPSAAANAELTAVAGDALARMTFIVPEAWEQLPFATSLLERQSVPLTTLARYFIAGHAAVKIWSDAVREASTTDRLLVSALLQSQSFETAAGRIGFNESGDLSKVQYAPHVWDEGKLTRISR